MAVRDIDSLIITDRLVRISAISFKDELVCQIEGRYDRLDQRLDLGPFEIFVGGFNFFLEVEEGDLLTHFTFHFCLRLLPGEAAL